MLCIESLLLRSQWARLKSSGEKELAEVIWGRLGGGLRPGNWFVRISGGKVFLGVRELRKSQGTHYLTYQWKQPAVKAERSCVGDFEGKLPDVAPWHLTILTATGRHPERIPRWATT